MFSFTLAFLQAFDSFLFSFNLFLLFAERGRRNLEESIHIKNHWPQLLHVSGIYRVSNWSLCLLCSIRFIFSKRKYISKSWRNLMNYKPENRIPWLSTDFENIKDFPWLFPDLEKCSFFPDFSLTVTTLILKHDDDGDGSEDDNNNQDETLIILNFYLSLMT